MLTRKETRGILREWKSFLAEAADKTTGPIIRIFDFDGTLTVYKDQEVGLLLKNPYMLSFINPSVAYSLNKKYSTIPSNIKEVLKDTSPSKKNYIISKISSTGFAKVKADKLINGLRNIDIKGDKNFEALAKFVIAPAVPNWKKLIDNDKIDEFLSEVGKVLNVETSEFMDTSKVSNEAMLMSQEDKIEQTLVKYKINDKFSRIYTKDNIAKQQEVPLEGGGMKLEPVAGTSGKFSPALIIATNAFREFANTLITFEIYDNSTSNVAEIESAILKASSGEQEEEEIDQKSEAAILASLKQEIGRHENVAIKKFQAVLVGDEYELKDLSDVHISKSKGQNLETVQESGPLLKFQKIKNKFFSLMKLLKNDGKKAGAPNKKTVAALDVAIQEDPSVGESVKELYANYIPTLGETGLESKYTSKTEVNNLSEEMLNFIVNYDSFKQRFLANKEQGRTPGDGGVVATKPAKVPKAPSATVQQAPTEQTPAESTVPPAAQPPEGQLAEWRASKSLKESLRNFKLVLKSK